MGEATSTPPLDLWVYQEIVCDVRPDLIVAVGTANAGYLADLCRTISHGEVLTILPPGPDVAEPVPRDRLRVVRGSAVAAEASRVVNEMEPGPQAVLAVLGLDNGDVLARIEELGGLVTVGSYLIVEGTTESAPGHGNGAVERFLGEHPTFVADRNREKLYLTFNGGGYLRRVG